MKTACKKLLAALHALASNPFDSTPTEAAVMDDGALLCPTCIHDNYKEIFRATKHADANGWRFCAVAASERAAGRHCVLCGRMIWGYRR